MERISKSIFSKIAVPKKRSAKGDNGLLLVIGGSEKYHGAPILAAKAASKIVDLVFFHSPAKINEKILVSMKRKSDCFVTIPSVEVEKTAGKCDCILVGNGLEVNAKNKRLVNRLLGKFRGKKFVLDAGALRMADRKLLGKNVLVTPHSLEFKSLFGASASPFEAKRQAEKFGCTVLLKKVNCFVTDGRRFSVNTNGNQGMAKGGTGDVLAGLAAGFACKNSLFDSACAAAFANGAAGDRLKKRKGFFYDADDLVEEIPFVLNKLFG